MSTIRPFPADDRGPGEGVEAREESGPGQATAGSAVRSDGESATESDMAAYTAEVRRLPLAPDEPGIVPRARDFTRQALRDWGWLPSSSADRRAAAEDVLLVVSELVTNACLHAGGPEELRLRHSPKAVRLEVADAGPGEPTPRTPHQAGRPGGHGMFIVQRLCLDWGVVRHGDRPGKTVWAELAAPS
jgi:anti-sigma regulatory factor (Ser/Thr protein kinase)